MQKRRGTPTGRPGTIPMLPGHEPSAGAVGPGIPRLLVSVTGLEEAREAITCGVDIIDLKDPSLGSLGACEPSVLRAVAGLSGGAVTSAGRYLISAAIGDAGYQPGTYALAAAGAAACGVDFIKIGLLGTPGARQARALLGAVVRAALSVSPAVRVIAAAYADAEEIGALPCDRLVAVAAAAGAHGCLIDTFSKDGRTLFDHLDPPRLSELVAQARRHRLVIGLSGSLGAADLPLLRAIGPDLIGVRGAACEGGRQGRLDARRLNALRGALRAPVITLA